VYQGILATIESSDYDVFERRAVVSRGRKCWITARNMALPVVRHVAARMASRGH